MQYTIENDFLKIGVNPVGCELTSVQSKSDGYEYLWQGDPSVWNGQSPILFPIVGRLIDDSYRLKGKSYAMPKHGFARRNDRWTLIDREDDLLRFMLSENEESMKIYPYAFDLIVTFILEDRRLRVTHTVVNKNRETMYFSIGAHPGFNCDMGDKLVFDEEETLSTQRIDPEKSLLLPASFPLLSNEKEIVITSDIFRDDALILSGMKSEDVTLSAHGGSRKIRFHFGKAPYLGVWAKPGAPYVCIEPWWGVNDGFERKNDLSEKEAIVALPAEELFECGWHADFF